MWQKSRPIRLFSNFDGGKQWTIITKNKAPSVSLLMVNNRDKNNGSSTVIDRRNNSCDPQKASLNGHHDLLYVDVKTTS